MAMPLAPQDVGPGSYIDGVSVVPVGDSHSRADADHARNLALSLNLNGEPSQGQVEAYVSLLLHHCGADPDRLADAVAICVALQANTRDGAADERDDSYHEAEVLLRRALRVVTDAGAETDAATQDRLREDLHAQLYPDPVPFDWPRDRRRSVTWWLRRLAMIRVRLIHRPTSTPAGVQKLTLQLGTRPVGTLVYQICDQCRRGLIGKVSITTNYQGLGLGRRAAVHVFRQAPDYAWRTTPQYPTSGTFWAGLAARTGADFTNGADCACDHMTQQR